MKASPQSQAALDKLLRGEMLRSGDVTVGPLDESTRILLKVFTDNYDDLRGRRGPDQAKALRRLYLEALPELPTGTPGQNEEEMSPSAQVSGTRAGAQAEAATPGPGWRVFRLQCQSIRGIAPLGERFSYSFEGKPTLIFGPNGSGKSSLMGAVRWVLTGETLTDAEEDAEDAPLYTAPKASGKNSKICDWPVIHTLPTTGDPRQVTTACWAEIELRSADGNNCLHLRRSRPGGLESSVDGVIWNACSSLAAHGIQPLDLQLSLITPTVFGRRSIESAPDTRRLLTLMLGFDDLERIGELASAVARNRTLLVNVEKQQIEEEWAALRQKLVALPERLHEKVSVRADVARLAALSQPSTEQIQAVESAVNQLVDSTEVELAQLLGLASSDVQTFGSLTDALTSAVMLLEKGVFHNFQRLSALRLEVVLPPIDTSSTVQLAGLHTALDGFAASAKVRIAKRLDWWRKEMLPGSKYALLIQAAQYYGVDEALCPVCEQSIDGLPVKAELSALKTMDKELLSQVKQVFRDLEEESMGSFLPGYATLLT